MKNRNVNTEESFSKHEGKYFDKEGMGTQPRPKYKVAQKGYDELEFKSQL